MRTVGRALLVVGVLVLALLIGVLIGRGQRVQPTAEGNTAATVQITTAPPPAAAPLPLPAPAPPPAPKVAPVPRIAPDLQVQEDAAAVGMTTRDEPDAGTAAPAPKSAGAAQPDPEPQG